jgi:hypothetical protein
LNAGDLLFIKANNRIKKYQIYSKYEIHDYMCTFDVNNNTEKYYDCSYSPSNFTIAARLILDYDAFSTFSNIAPLGRPVGLPRGASASKGHARGYTGGPWSKRPPPTTTKTNHRSLFRR